MPIAIPFPSEFRARAVCRATRSNQGLGSRRVVGLEAKRAGQVLSPPSAMCLVKFGMAGGTRPVCVTLAVDGYGHRCLHHVVVVGVPKCREACVEQRRSLAKNYGKPNHDGPFTAWVTEGH